MLIIRRKNFKISLNLKLSDPSNIEKYVKITKLNIDNKLIVSRLENIGIYKNEIIYVKSNHFNKNITLIEINQTTYGIRKEDADFIIVKKV
ncbi:ferrous iron transport protein A [bacterium]|nr:ferrous iron transport protein A [bacterium]